MKYEDHVSGWGFIPRIPTAVIIYYVRVDPPWEILVTTLKSVYCGNFYVTQAHDFALCEFDYITPYIVVL